MERITGLEPATSTLARWRSTKWAKSANYEILKRIGKKYTIFLKDLSAHSKNREVYVIVWDNCCLFIVYIQSQWFIFVTVQKSVQKYDPHPRAATNKEKDQEKLEAPPRFELGRKGFADLCLTAWLWRHIGADYGARTRHLHLGKVALYQMS